MNLITVAGQNIMLLMSHAIISGKSFFFSRLRNRPVRIKVKTIPIAKYHAT